MWFMGFNGIAWDRKWDLDSKVGLVHYKQLVYLHVYVHVMKAPFVWQTWHLVTASMSKVVLFGRGNSFAWPL